MRNLFLLFGIVLVVGGCSSTGQQEDEPFVQSTEVSITSAEEAYAAMERFGFDCTDRSPGGPFLNGLYLLECDSEVKTYAAALGFAATEYEFRSSSAADCLQSAYGQNKDKEILGGKTWFFRLHDDQEAVLPLERMQSEIGGEINTIVGYCASLQ